MAADSVLGDAATGVDKDVPCVEAATAATAEIQSRLAVDCYCSELSTPMLATSAEDAVARVVVTELLAAKLVLMSCSSPLGLLMPVPVVLHCFLPIMKDVDHDSELEEELAI